MMRYANGNADLSNCFKVLVDGVAQPGIRFNAPQTGDGSGKSEWYNFADAEPFYVCQRARIPCGLRPMATIRTTITWSLKRAM